MTIDALFNRADISASITKKSLEGNKEYERMLAGKPYNSFDKDLILARTISSEIAGAYADIKLSDHGYDIEKHQKSRADYLSKYLFFKRVPDITLNLHFLWILDVILSLAIISMPTSMQLSLTVQQLHLVTMFFWDPM